MALSVRSLSKRYGKHIALHQIDLTLKEGVTAVLGANGSGKSTLLRILATLCQPDTGDLSFNGLVYGRDDRRLRAQIGYLPQVVEMPDTLTARKLLTYLARLRGGEVDKVIVALHLESFINVPFGQLSGGQLRMVGFAQALLGNPRLLLLDELSRGLDAIERQRVYRLLAGHSRFILFSTHLPSEAEQIAQTVIVLHRGKVLFSGDIETLRDYATGQVYELEVATEVLPQIITTSLISRIIQNGETSLVRIIGKPLQSGAAVVKPSLEDAYLIMTHAFNDK
jgi:ABC-2 type transport system ATP-binding protein